MKMYPAIMMAAVTSLFTVPASAEVINAVIRLKETVPLEQLAKNVSSPDSDRYGKFYSPEEIAQLSGPDAGSYQALLGQLQNEGFTVVKESKTHLWLSVRADSSVFEKVFQTQFEYSAKKERKSLVEASVPVYMNLIESVGGLNSNRKSRPKYVRADQYRSLDNSTALAPNAPAAPAAGPTGISPAVIKTVYGFDPIYSSGLTAKGQSIAIATYDDFNLSDVQYFYKTQKISPAPVVDKVPFNGTPQQNDDSAVETQLDVEFSGMMGVGANIHVFSSAVNSDTGELQMFTAILDDNRAKVVNYSWGGCETQLSPQHQADMDKVYVRAVAQGVNIMVASGDSGSDACQDGSVAADWPAADANVVAVGGTTLSVSNSQGSETGWSGSGGGISKLFALPAWQQNIGAAFTKRSFPDVSFNADPMSGESVYAHSGGSAQWITIGGTSMAAPQWSGFLALVGAARAAAGKGPIGYLNPIIYGLSQSDYQANFNDVTSGSNGAFSAGPGYDAVTGLGSMKASSLLSTLVNQ
jgi:kumamolisin